MASEKEKINHNIAQRKYYHTHKEYYDNYRKENHALIKEYLGTQHREKTMTIVNQIYDGD